MKTLKRSCVLAVALSAMLCAGCDVKEGVAAQDNNDGSISVSNGWGSAGVTEIHLKDGTHCAVLVGSYKGAITCNWRGDGT